jgi:hypothetical protein
MKPATASMAKKPMEKAQFWEAALKKWPRFAVPPCPVNGGWGSQPHVVEFQRKMQLIEDWTVDKLLADIVRLPKDEKEIIKSFLYLPPLPVPPNDGGWGVQQHILDYKRKYASRKPKRNCWGARFPGDWGRTDYIGQTW